MDKAVEFIQNNIYVNSFKDAINKVAFLNIGIALFVLSFKWLGRMDYLNIETDVAFEVLYQLAMVFFAVILIYNIVNTILHDEKTGIKLSVIFMSFLFVFPFIKTPGYLPAFPVLGSLVAYTIIFFSKKMKRFSIEEKNNVPKAVTDYFNMLFPIILVMLISGTLLVGFTFLYDKIILVYLTIIGFSSHLVVLLIVILLVCLFWYLGLHGVGVVSSVMRPFWFQMMLFNTYFVIIDAPLPYIGTETFLQWFVWLGGSGATLGLTLSLRYFSKSKTLKELGENSINSNLHNINENIIFGTPIVKNRYFRIPFFTTPIILALIGYFSISYGWVDNFAIVTPWVLPVPFGAFISSLGSWRTLFLSVVLIVVSWIIYFPFFKAYDNKILKEELNNIE